MTSPHFLLAMYWHERTHHSVAHQWFRQAVRDALPGDLKQPGVMLRVASR